DVHTHILFAGDDPQLGFQRLDALAGIVDLRRHGVLADRHARAGGIEQADRLVRQLAGGNVAVRQLHRGFQRLVEDLHLVVLLHHAGHAAHHQDRLLFARLVDLHGLEATGQRRILLDVLLVFGPGGGADRAQVAARQCGLEQVRRIASASCAACTSSMTCLRRFSNSPFMLAPACSRPTSSARNCTSFSGGGTSPMAMRMAKPSITAVLPTPASPTSIGLFWRRRIRMSTSWRISSSRPTIGSILPLRACSVRSMVNCASASCLPICAGDIAPLASPGAEPPPILKPSLALCPSSGEPPTTSANFSTNASGLILSNSAEILTRTLRRLRVRMQPTIR